MKKEMAEIWDINNRSIILEGKRRGTGQQGKSTREIEGMEQGVNKVQFK